VIHFLYLSHFFYLNSHVKCPTIQKWSKTSKEYRRSLKTFVSVAGEIDTGVHSGSFSASVDYSKYLFLHFFFMSLTMIF